MLFDRTAGAWKLLPPLPPTVFAANGSPVSGYDKRQITALLVGANHDSLEGVVHLHDLLGRGRLFFK